MNEQKEESWLTLVTKTLTPTDNSKKAKRQNKNVTKQFKHTLIADRHRTISWNNDSNPTGVAKPMYGIPTFIPTNHKSCTWVIKRTHIKKIDYNPPYRDQWPTANKKQTSGQIFKYINVQSCKSSTIISINIVQM